MSLNDPLGDLLTRIRNGQAARLSEVQSPGSKLRANVLDVLKREGYIRDFKVVQMMMSMPRMLSILSKLISGKTICSLMPSA